MLLCFNYFRQAIFFPSPETREKEKKEKTREQNQNKEGFLAAYLFGYVLKIH